ncbi:unnamed protein product [Didymodactylos carnosus]|uniref:Ras-related protein Rab-35 n=1 Tax=Didymodactylos carnosus TaxID=1234261 RepID=A0A814RD60_9BILA|nr:unnamed protein product [Didymodactylos carnosus]CAF1131577.1 unnamed protein product [Didymodactylos carnosus]CAF3673901.1 unnamed protein product [Didymodactylos carnosus]CAF3895353.1 unnamed protein product [Didymodactylos carnosus]
MARSTEIFHFKILIIGESSVGKSSLMTRFVDQTFQSTFIPTVGVDFKVRTLIVDDYQCKVQIWDTAGQERFRVITTTYYRDASGVLIVYDVTNGDTFSKVRRWIDEINKHCDETIAKVLVGNKDDSDVSSNKVVLTEDAQQYSKHMDLAFYETSARDNKNVDKAFYEVTRLALKNRLESRLIQNKNQANYSSKDNLNSKAASIRLKKNVFGGSGKKYKKDKNKNGGCCKSG